MLPNSVIERDLAVIDNNALVNKIQILATEQTVPSSIYGIYDILSCVGRLWREISSYDEECEPFRIEIISQHDGMFKCHGNIPIKASKPLSSIFEADLLIIPSQMIFTDDYSPTSWTEECYWVSRYFKKGGIIGSVCTGSLLLAYAGVLKNKSVTGHWALKEMFSSEFPDTKFDYAKTIVTDGQNHELISAGGVLSWQDLCFYIIRRFRGQAEASRIAKSILFGDRTSGQNQFMFGKLLSVKDDKIILATVKFIREHYNTPNLIFNAIKYSELNERTFKRRFKLATGVSPIEMIQSVRIEKAKDLLENSNNTIEHISLSVGYEDVSFFRKIFKRSVGLTPSIYRRKFKGIGSEKEYC